jgi:hypothetical protein
MKHSSTEKLIYHRDRDRAFTNDRCFLCGKGIKNANHDEHIFPKWLQNYFKLWDEEIYLLNGTTIPYRNLKIPCCKSCNTIHLSNIEKIVQSNFRGGYKKFKNIDKSILFAWLSKILYGMLFKELFLPLDRKDFFNGNTIMEKEHFEKLDLLHFLMQSSRIPFKYQERTPWSIFIFNAQVSKDIKKNFDYKDSLLDFVIYLRLKDIIILACLIDNNVNEELFNDYFQPMTKIKLHPIQGVEIFSRVMYKMRLLNRTPKYISIYGNKDITVIPLPFAGFSAKPIFDDWDNEKYAYIFSFHSNIPYEQVFYSKEKVFSWLHNEDNSIRIISDDEEFS